MHTFILLVFASCALAQNRVLAPQEIVGPGLPAQKIGADDLLSVSVYDAPELTRSIRVGSDGRIRLPLVKQKIVAMGLFPSELETVISAALEAEKVLVEPVVTVNIIEYRSRPISVAGAVKKPLTFQAFGNVTLLDALTRAEGLSPEAGSEILVSRVQKGEDGSPTTLVQRVMVKGLIDGADPNANVKLYGGEEIRVPDAGKVFVVGNVKKPGAFSVQDISDTTVLKVLALAEGLTPFAMKQAYIYRREGASGGKNEIPIELARIMERKSPDVPLQANDILYVPDNKNRRLSVSALERLVSFGSATASGMLTWGVVR